MDEGKEDSVKLNPLIRVPWKGKNIPVRLPPSQPSASSPVDGGASQDGSQGQLIFQETSRFRAGGLFPSLRTQTNLHIPPIQSDRASITRRRAERNSRSDIMWHSLAAPGTVFVPFKPAIETNDNKTNVFQNISSMDFYKNWSAEELRLSDYHDGIRHPSSTNTKTTIKPRDSFQFDSAGSVTFSGKFDFDGRQLNFTTTSANPFLFPKGSTVDFKKGKEIEQERGSGSPQTPDTQSTVSNSRPSPVFQFQSGFTSASNTDEKPPADNFTRSRLCSRPLTVPIFDKDIRIAKPVTSNHAPIQLSTRPTIPTTESHSLPSNCHRQSTSNTSVASFVDASTQTENPVEPPIPYRVEDEDAPDHPFFSIELRDALKVGEECAKGVETLARSLAGIVDDESRIFLENLKNDGQKLSVYKGAEAQTIAFIGDLGQGKSSLINSLLHYPDIAKTGSGDSVCTTVIIEYHQKRTDHGGVPITIEAEFLTKSEVTEMVKELLWSFRQLFLPGVESDATPSPDYRRYARESEFAWSALEAAFKHHPEFGRDMLKDMSQGAQERLEEMFIKWSADIQWPASTDASITGAGLWRETAETAKECNAKTGLFAQDRYWPFTKVIRVYLNSQVLKTGLVLADLPSLQDANLARVRATQNYLMKCNKVFIVANITNAMTNQSLKSSVYQVANYAPLERVKPRGSGFSVVVVCTRSEDIDLRWARSEFVGQGKRIEQSVMDDLDTAIKQARERGDYNRKKELKHRQKWYLINARNTQVIEGLQKAYSLKVPNQQLQVFCVSNTAYEQHCLKGNATLVQNSGVPALRKFCRGITADAQHKEANIFLTAPMIALMNFMILWADYNLENLSENSIYAERGRRRDESLYSDLEIAHTKLKEKIEEFGSGFDNSFKEQISEMSEQRMDDWQKEAKKEGVAWLSWHWTEYHAFCRNNGHHASHKHLDKNWNANILWKMRSELEYQWDIVEDDVVALFDELQNSFQRIFDGYKIKIQGEKGSQKPANKDSKAPSNVCNYLELILLSRIPSVMHSLKLLGDTFSRELNLIRRRASDASANSYVSIEMTKVYRSSTSSKDDQRTPGRQKSVVQAGITKGELFPIITIMTSSAIEELLDRTMKYLSKLTEYLVAQLKTDLDLIFWIQKQRGGTRHEDAIASEIKSSASDMVARLADSYKQMLHKMFKM